MRADQPFPADYARNYSNLTPNKHCCGLMSVANDELTTGSVEKRGAYVA